MVCMKNRKPRKNGGREKRRRQLLNEVNVKRSQEILRLNERIEEMDARFRLKIFEIMHESPRPIKNQYRDFCTLLNERVDARKKMRHHFQRMLKTMAAEPLKYQKELLEKEIEQLSSEIRVGQVTLKQFNKQLEEME